MGHLQKTPVGLARRMLSFEENAPTLSTPISLPSDVMNLEHCIPPISEAVESLTSESVSATIITNTHQSKGDGTPLSVRRSTKTIAELKPPKLNEAPRESKPKSPWKVGKAGKNAVNSEVQSQSWAQRLTQTQNCKTPLHNPAPKTLPQNVGIKAQPQTSTLRGQPVTAKVQPLPKFDFSQPQSKSRVMAKPEQQRLNRISPRSTKPIQKEDGWETVRGRTRSRTSPIKTTTPLLTRSSTVIYTPRLDNKKSPMTNRPMGQRHQRLGQLNPSATQSLPSLCDDIVNPAEKPLTRLSVTSLTADTDEVIETETVDQLVEEEAEMARREEALTKEEENLQREMRETERSDTEGDEWEDPINVTPVIVYFKLFNLAIEFPI